jgi:hypothetical protein
MKKIALLTAIAASLLSFQAQAIVIDDFSDDTTAIIVSTVGGTASAFTAGGMIGGERDIQIEKLANPFPGVVSGGGSVTAEVTGGRFIYGQSGSSFGQAVLQWDGVDGSMNLNKTGLGGVDLTQNGGIGFSFTAFAEQNLVLPLAEVLVTVWGSNGIDNASYTIEAFNTFVDITETILFNDVDWTKTGGFNFNSVGAIEIVLNINGDSSSLDVELDIIETTIPEPSSMLLAGLALTGMGFAARRRRIK